MRCICSYFLYTFGNFPFFAITPNSESESVWKMEINEVKDSLLHPKFLLLVMDPTAIPKPNSFTFAFFFFLLLSSSSSSFPAAVAVPTIYDLLHHYGLPIGLFPKGIADFSLDPTTGRFQVNLTRPCNAKFENQLHYDFNVSGFLSFAKIANLSGISQQELFLWFPVNGIRVDVPTSGLIYFDVGVVRKQFSLSLFETPPDCSAFDLHPEPLSIALSATSSKIQSERSRKPGAEVDQQMLKAAS